MAHSSSSPSTIMPSPGQIIRSNNMFRCSTHFHTFCAGCKIVDDKLVVQHRTVDCHHARTLDVVTVTLSDGSTRSVLPNDARRAFHWESQGEGANVREWEFQNARCGCSVCWSPLDPLLHSWRPGWNGCRMFYRGVMMRVVGLMVTFRPADLLKHIPRSLRAPRIDQATAFWEWCQKPADDIDQWSNLHLVFEAAGKALGAIPTSPESLASSTSSSSGTLASSSSSSSSSFQRR